MSYLPHATAAPPLSDRLTLLPLRVRLAACGDGPLPAALGATLHGALGRALKLTACALPNPEQQPCAPCRLRLECPYPRLFEPQHRATAGTSAPPPALLLAPQGAQPGRLAPGTPLLLDLALVGHAVAALPLLLTVLERMAAHGIGPLRVPCTVVRVDALDAAGRPAAPVQIGNRLQGGFAPSLSAAAWLAQAGALIASTPGAERSDPDAPRDLRLRLTARTPLRLQRDGDVPRRPPGFDELARALVRRADALARSYGDEQDPFPDPRPWLEAAATVRLVEAHTDWRAQQRRSASTGHRMPTDGLVGTLTYRGPRETLAAFAPLLLLGEAIGVGRGCSFGNGRYSLAIAPA